MQVTRNQLNVRNKSKGQEQLVAFENKENLNHENYHRQNNTQSRTKLVPKNIKNENNIMRIEKKVENVLAGITIKNTINVNKKSKTKTSLYAPNYMSKNKTSKSTNNIIIKNFTKLNTDSNLKKNQNNFNTITNVSKEKFKKKNVSSNEFYLHQFTKKSYSSTINVDCPIPNIRKKSEINIIQNFGNYIQIAGNSNSNCETDNENLFTNYSNEDAENCSNRRYITDIEEFVKNKISKNNWDSNNMNKPQTLNHTTETNQSPPKDPKHHQNLTVNEENKMDIEIPINNYNECKQANFNSKNPNLNKKNPPFNNNSQDQSNFQTINHPTNDENLPDKKVIPNSAAFANDVKNINSKQNYNSNNNNPTVAFNAPAQVNYKNNIPHQNITNVQNTKFNQNNNGQNQNNNFQNHNINTTNSNSNDNSKFIPILQKYEKNIPLEYIPDIWKNLKLSENCIACMPKFDKISQQTDINFDMRAILIDWIIDVHKNYKLYPETLYVCVSIIDRFLSKKHIMRTKLQLLGTTALFISSKYEEIIYPSIDEFTKVTDDAYSKEEVLQMEKEIFTELEFDLTYPSAFRFFEIISLNYNFSEVEFYYGSYLLEYFLISPNSNKYCHSIIALAVVLLILKLKKYENYRDLYNLTDSLENQRLIKECAREIYEFPYKCKQFNLFSVYNKYATPQYHSVAINELENHTLSDMNLNSN